MLGTINAVVNLKQFSPIILIFVEINWPRSGFAIAVFGCRVTCASNNKYIIR